MSILSKRSLRTIDSDYFAQYRLRVLPIGTDGQALDPVADGIRDLPVVTQARAHGLRESARWGDPYVFFLAPGVISWVVPLVDGYSLQGGLVGGEVVAEDTATDRIEALEHLVRGGAARKAAAAFVEALPVWPLDRVQLAANDLMKSAYQVSSLRPHLLEEHRERATQQRQIAEAIDRGKRHRPSSPLFDAERMLLSLIRAGDRGAARHRLNEILGTVFLRSANLAVVRALMVEMMGYLVRTAVEDSPHLEPLIERNHGWMARVINAPDFETLATVLRESLDDFMDSIYREGYQPRHPAVRAALDFIDGHFQETIRLTDVAKAAGLSTFRISHLLKQDTGRTVIQHVHHRRVREAQKLLQTTDESCAEIGYSVGFSDQSYFTLQFRRITGVTPARYRKAHS